MWLPFVLFVAMSRSSVACSKRKRVLPLVGLKNVSNAGLCEISSVMSTMPQDEAIVSKWRVEQTILQEYNKFGTSIDIPLQNGRIFKWYHCRLDLLVSYFCVASLFFRELMQRTMDRVGIGFLHLVLYIDEVTPGNVLSPDNKRKAHCIYVSIMEFGIDVLFKTAAWLPVALLRSSVVKRVSGGLSCCCRLLLESWFCGQPLQLESLGCVVDVTPPRIARCRFGRLLADADALRAVNSIKGHNGLKPCCACRNCMLKDHPSCTVDSYQTDICCFEFDRFDPATDDDFWTFTDRLTAAEATWKAGNDTKANFGKLEKAIGIKHHKNSIGNSIPLREHYKPVSCEMKDPMHILYVAGVFSIELHNFLEVCMEKTRYGYKHIQSLIDAEWFCPCSLTSARRNLTAMFSESREEASKKASHTKANASQLLSAYPLIRLFAEMFLVPLGVMGEEIKAFFMMCDVIDLIQMAKKQHYTCAKTHAMRMARAIKAYLDQAVSVYGEDIVRPKHHFLLHVPVQFLRDLGLMLDCFVTERMHAYVKAYMTMVRNSRIYERTVVANIVIERVRQMATMKLGDSLLGTRIACPTVSSMMGCVVHMSRTMQLGGASHSCDDIVFVQHRCFLVKACLEIPPTFGLALEELTRIQPLSATSSTWRLAGSPVAVVVVDSVGPIVQPHYWCIDGNGVFKILHTQWL